MSSCHTMKQSLRNTTCEFYAVCIIRQEHSDLWRDNSWQLEQYDALSPISSLVRGQILFFSASKTEEKMKKPSFCEYRRDQNLTAETTKIFCKDRFPELLRELEETLSLLCDIQWDLLCRR